MYHLVLLLLRLILSKVILVLNIRQSSWTDVLNAFGSLATVGAFIMLFIRDKNKQEQLNRLTIIANSLKDQNEISRRALNASAQPVLWLNGIQRNVFESRYNIKLHNKGERATLLSFEKIIGECIEVFPLGAPYDLERDQQRNIFCRLIGIGPKNINDIQFEMLVTYKDRLNNKFSVKIKGNGDLCRIIEQSEIVNH